MNISVDDENGEEVFNIFRNLLRDISNITMYDTYHDFLENNINNRHTRYNNNNNNNNQSTTYDICNNMVFTVINEYNVNMLEYNVNMREYLINNSNTTNHNINTNDTNNSNDTNNINTNFIEYNNNVSDYNSNMRRFLDLISTINYNISSNNSRNYRTSENIRQQPRQTYRTNTTNANTNQTNTTNRTNPFGRNPVYTYTPTQLLSYYLPNRQRTFTNVVVRPSELQIIDATQLINYSDSETYNNTSCPITMEEFNNGEQICQIKHCGHNFREDALRNWFTTNVRCPVCRYDIRDYIVSDASNGNDLSGNNNYPTGFLNRDDINTLGSDVSNNVAMDYSGNSIPRLNVNTTRSSSGNLSNIIQSYVEQHITSFVDELNSNLTDFDIILPIIYYNDASGYLFDVSMSRLQR